MNTGSDSDSGSDKPKSRKRKWDSDEDFDPGNLEDKNKPKKLKQAPKVEAGSSKPKAVSPKKQAKSKVKAEKLPKKPRAPRPTKKNAEPKLADKINTESFMGMEWDVAEYLASLQQIDGQVACNIIRLLDEENTIPFIARYRKELTGDMSPEKLREVKEAYEILECVKQKANTVLNNINKLGKLTPVLERSIRCSRTLNELDHIYAPFKPGSKRTLAERARQLGLEAPAIALLTGSEIVNLFSVVQVGKEGLSSIEEVESGVKHIIADIISKDRLVLERLRQIKEEAHIKLESTKARGSVKQAEKPESLKGKQKKSKDKPNVCKTNDKAREDIERKFENYFNFSAPVKFIKPHQVLAINRGENLKVLSVKILIPDWVMERVGQFCYRQWLNIGFRYPLRNNLVDASIKDAYTRLMQPLLVRQVRSDLNQSAVRAAVEVFATNLKNLLLSPPLRGSTILGIDPGFRNGCKIALTSQSGGVLHTDIIYPRFGQDIPPHCDPNACKLRELLTNFNCQLVAVGNGTACRETESYLSHLIQSRWFSPLDVTYTIVSEQGASIYSCSPEAKKEFPDLDANLVSAVSLARRVQDPLGELVKVEPKHLGVGMYQHDVPEKQLSSTLEEVVVECVSFVGVDINTASLSILQRVAGLNQVRANNILQWRSSHCCFFNRQQLLQVKGIGPKTFQQCAGFIRIIPETTQSQIDGSDANPNTGKSRAKKLKVDDNTLNPLDRTWIHPESYDVATKFIEKCGVNLNSLGTPDFIKSVSNAITKIGLSILAAELNVDEPAMKLISDGLQQAPGHDLRSEFSQPLFRRGLTSISDLTAGTVLTGRVQNVTHFGVFVDIGVGTNGLIPASRLRNVRTQLGDRVEVRVFSIEEQRKRISLDLVRVL